MQKNNLHYFFRASYLLIIIGIFFVNNIFLPSASGQSETVEEPVTEMSPSNIQPTNEIVSPAKSAPLLETPVFNTDSQLSVLVKPNFNDDSTNIAFYMQCPSEACPNDGSIESPVFIFSAENLGHGILPFSDYWTPPFPSNYIAIEYKNDNQQFSCSSISFDECLADPRFVKSFHFSLVENNVDITTEMLIAKTILNNPAPNLESPLASSTASTDLLLLSITLSSTSISSNLDNGLIVTASLDGIPGVAIASVFDTATQTEAGVIVSSSTEDEGSSVGSFIMDIIEDVIDIFTPEEALETETTPTETISTESVSSETNENEPVLVETISSELIQTETESSPVEPPPSQIPNTTPEPLTENTPEESTPENEVQSSVSSEEVINNEIITTEF